jgi:hypothetical protein
LIEDKPVVAIEARGSEARELCKEEWFLEELSLFKSNGENRSIGPGCEYVLGRPPKRSGSGTTEHAAPMTIRKIWCSFILWS